MNVPELRFPEFSGEWEKKLANEIFKNHSNKNHDGNLPILAVTQNKGVVERNSIDIKINTTSKSIASYKIIDPGDFVISLRSFQGGIEYSSIKGISSPAYTVLKPKIEIVDNFFKFYLKKEEFISRLNSAVIGIRDGKQISFSVFSEMKLPYTSIDEQEKIASFLSKVDEKIEKLEKKQELWETYKKGMMQKIFSQELRFKDENGQNYPDWEENKLIEIGKISTGNTPATKNQEYYNNGKYLWVTPSDISSSKYISNSERKLSEIGIKKARIVPKNSVLITCIASIGKNCIITENGSFNQQINSITPNKEFSNEFIYYLLGKNSDKLKKYAGVTATPILNKKSFENMKFKFPCKEEQIQISNVLSAIDIKLEQLIKEIKINKEFKKGLLQQMFC